MLVAVVVSNEDCCWSNSCFNCFCCCGCRCFALSFSCFSNFRKSMAVVAVDLDVAALVVAKDQQVDDRHDDSFIPCPIKWVVVVVVRQTRTNPTTCIFFLCPSFKRYIEHCRYIQDLTYESRVSFFFSFALFYLVL